VRLSDGQAPSSRTTRLAGTVSAPGRSQSGHLHDRLDVRHIGEDRPRGFSEVVPSDELAAVGRLLASEPRDDASIQRLLTIPGADVTNAVTLGTAVGDVSRLPGSRSLVGRLTLHYRVRQRAAAPLTMDGPPRRDQRRPCTVPV